MTFDVYEFCSATLQKQLQPGRDLELKIREGSAKEGTGPLLDTGFYELKGVVTHKGLSADSGHYIG